MNLSPGTNIAGLYRADRRIGVGGMGEVWAGVRLSDNLDVAIKVLLTHTVDANEVTARFRREAQVLARVRSKYVAQVLDFLAEEDGFVLVMELIPGDSLHAVLSYDQTIAIETTLDLVSDVLRGLRDLHNANIVHRDLKPGNIVLRPRPGLRPRATLIDFGVSRIMSDPDEEEVTAITRGDRVLGTLEYMAPEQILGSRTVTGTADLYAVGAMMYRAIAGHHVFGDLQEGLLAVAKLNEDAPLLDIGRTDDVAVRTRVLVSRLLSRRLRDRFKTAEEALAEVDSIRALVPDRTPDEQSLTFDEELTLSKSKKRLASRVETSRSGPQIEINIRAAVPIEEPSTIEMLPSHPQPDTPMSAEVPSYQPRRSVPDEAHPWRTLGIAAALFVFGSAGGGLFGVSYARGGLAYQLIQAASGATAAPPSTPLPPAPPASLPIEPPAPPASSSPVIDLAVVDIGSPDAESIDAAPTPSATRAASPSTARQIPPPASTPKPSPPKPTAENTAEDTPSPKQPDAFLPEEP